MTTLYVMITIVGEFHQNVPLRLIYMENIIYARSSFHLYRYHQFVIELVGILRNQ